MSVKEPCHYLIGLSYHARVLSYLLAMLVTLSFFAESAVVPESVITLSLVLLLYPHVAFQVTWRYFNSAEAARNNLFIDSLLVGALVVTNDFHLFASVSFVSALALSTLIVARPATMVVSMLILGTVIGAGWILYPGLNRSASLFSDMVCGLSIITYGCLVAYKGFNMTTQLVQSRRLVEQSNQQLTGITDRLRRYISPQIYSAIDPKQHIHNTARKHLTVFFSDIEGFTEIMDNLEEEMVGVVLNEYLNSMTEIAIEHGGTIDKFMGDGIMVFFGDPKSRGHRQDAFACVQMALEMRLRLKCLRGKWRRSGIFSDLHIRIGVNSGYCAVGNFGSENRLDYTAVGSTVNIASRLEGKATRDSILISNSTYRLISQKIQCRQQPVVKVKGIRRPIENYSVIGQLATDEVVVINQNIPGFQVSLNPKTVDAGQARRIIAQVEDALSAAEARDMQSGASVRLTG